MNPSKNIHRTNMWKIESINYVNLFHNTTFAQSQIELLSATGSGALKACTYLSVSPKNSISCGFYNNSTSAPNFFIKELPYS